MLKVLIAEDDEIILGELEKLFRRSGYDVLIWQGMDTLSESFDIAILDIGLPDISGYDICVELRKTKQCPVIFLTSQSAPSSELRGFAVGADDYVRKPFDPSVLLARAARLLGGKQAVITAGKLSLDTVKLEVTGGDKRITLSKTEFGILRILCEKGGVVSGKEIVEKLWDSDSYVDENTLYVNINRLREKLKEVCAGCAIKTVRGAGYLLEQQ